MYDVKCLELAKSFLSDHPAIPESEAGELAQEIQSRIEEWIEDRKMSLSMAEALAEYLHKEARIAWGFGRDEQLSNADLIREKYRGIRR